MHARALYVTEQSFGTYEQFNSRLYEYAVSTGKIIKISFLEEQLAQL